jgi:multicomponent Na+:H+ antiporter subunit D
MRPFYENLPFICIFIAIICGVLSAVIRDGRKAYRLALTMSAVIAVLSAILLYCIYTKDVSFAYSMGKFAAPYGNAIKAGPLQALMATAFAIVMGLSLLGGGRSLFHDILPEKQGLYFVMTDLLLAGLLALVYTNDMFTGYVFIEITTIAACAMVMAKDTGPNLIATIRYLFMSLLGSGLFLIGLTLLNSITGYLLMEPLAKVVMILAELGQYHRPLIMSIGLMVVGLGIKGAMFPFHLWLPDAHGGATTSSSAILSGLVLKGYIVLLITLMTRVFGLELMRKVGVSNILLTLGLLGMIFGSLAAMREYHVKRMLANSSVAQIGYIFMGLGLGTTAGIAAACFHILVHAACKPLLFICAGRLSTVSGHHRSLNNLRGSAYRDVAAGVGFTVGALSMIGIPLLGGFVSKLCFSEAALESPFMAAVLLTIAASTVLNALYYVPAILAIWVRPAWEEAQIVMLEVKPEDTRFDRLFFIAASVFIFLIFLLGIGYHPILNVIEAGIRLM